MLSLYLNSSEPVQETINAALKYYIKKSSDCEGSLKFNLKYRRILINNSYLKVYYRGKGDPIRLILITIQLDFLNWN